MANTSSFLDGLTINPEYERLVGGSAFTRVKTFILGWLISYPESQTYTEMMRGFGGSGEIKTIAGYMGAKSLFPQAVYDEKLKLRNGFFWHCLGRSIG